MYTKPTLWKSRMCTQSETTVARSDPVQRPSLTSSTVSAVARSMCAGLADVHPRRPSTRAPIASKTDWSRNRFSAFGSSFARS